MTLRLTSSAITFESAVWSPVDTTVLQLSGLYAVVQVQARVSTDAPWATLATLRDDEPFARLAKMPYLKLVMSRNTAGNLAQVWDDE
jgi:hypothetical protein